MDFSDSPSYPPAQAPRSSSALAWVLVVLIVLVLGAGAWFGYQNNWWRTVPAGYQAVFLSDGQVYFGRIVRETGSTIVLQDIYYLKNPGPLQAGRVGEAPPELAMVKLGNEVHGPQDEMRINREHVLFTETLKQDSKVVQAIEQYKQGIR